MKSANSNILTAMFCVAVVLSTVTAASAQTRVAFDRNNQATLTGSVSRGQTRQYLFSAKAGQEINISLTSESASAMRIRLTSNVTGQALPDQSGGDTGDMMEQTFNASLPDDGDYTVTITSSDSTAANFELQFTKG